MSKLHSKTDMACDITCCMHFHISIGDEREKTFAIEFLGVRRMRKLSNACSTLNKLKHNWTAVRLADLAGNLP